MRSIIPRAASVVIAVLVLTLVTVVAVLPTWQAGVYLRYDTLYAICVSGGRVRRC